MTVALTDEQMALIRQLMERGGFTSAEAVVGRAIALLAETQIAVEEDRELLRKMIADVWDDPGQEITASQIMDRMLDAQG